MKFLLNFILTIVLIMGICAQEKTAKQEQAAKPATEEAPAKTADSDTTKNLSPHSSADLGIGPIKELKLTAVDNALAKKGEKLFKSKCLVCHSLDEKNIGPPLRNVLNERAPEFVMNLLLNTSEMEQKDSTMKTLIKQYMIPMPPQSLTENEAREILEYLRLAAEQTQQK